MIAILGLITVRTPQQLSALSLQTYIFGAIIGVIFLVMAAVIATMIKFEGGSHPKDPRKRRSWFWILVIVALIVSFLYNMFGVAPTVSNNLQGDFMSANVTGTLIAIATYVILGFLLSKMFSTGKLGNWFPSRKRK